MAIPKHMPFLWVLLLLVGGCKPTDDGVAPSNMAQVQLRLFHGRAGIPLLFGEPTTTARGEKVTLRVARYYLSNPVLIDDAGKRTPLGAWYHLVSVANPASLAMGLPSIAPGRYAALELMLGVDSARNTSGAQTGALAVDSAMFWTWSTGYIHTKLEGDLARSPSGGFAWHMGGFKAPNANQRIIRLAFSPLSVTASETLHIATEVDIMKILETTPMLILDEPFISDEGTGRLLAEPWAAAFSIDSAWVR